MTPGASPAATSTAGVVAMANRSCPQTMPRRDALGAARKLPAWSVSKSALAGATLDQPRHYNKAAEAGSRWRAGAQHRGGAESVLQSTTRLRSPCHEILGSPHHLEWTCTMPLPCKVPVSLPSWLTCSCLCGLFLFGAASLRAEPSTGEGWTVATLGRDGSWGSRPKSLAHAIGMAVSK
jgi:hypothetical protein